MKLKSLLLGAAVATAALAATAGSASAYIVCNTEGDCWHSETRYTRPGITFQYYPDDWYFHRRWTGDRSDRYRYRPWRDDVARGYWRNGVWVTF